MRVNGDKIVFRLNYKKDGVSARAFTSYDEAAAEVEQLNYTQGPFDPLEGYTVVTQVDPEEHYRIISELIAEYYLGSLGINDPIIVMYSRRKQYAIAPRAILTPQHWRKDPYVDYGPLEQWERIIEHRKEQSV